MAGADALAPLLPRGPGDRVTWTGLKGSALGLALASAARIAGGAREAPGPLFVITADNPEAERLEAQIRFFANADRQDGAAPLELMHVPDWETLPYDVFSPHHDIVSERLSTLHRLPGMREGLVVAPVTTLMARVPPRTFLDAESLVLAPGDRLDIEAFRVRLEAAGYRCVSQVMEHGEFAVRGALLDLFPMGAKLPLRIDLFDDEIETLRTFDPDTQRTADRLERIDLLPAREFPMTEAAIAGFRQRWRARFEGDPSACPIYRDVSQGLSPAGIEYYLPLFFDGTATLFDYLPAESVIVMTEGAHDAGQAYWAEITERHEQSRHDRERPLLDPVEVFLTVDEAFGAAAEHPSVRVTRDEPSADAARDARGQADFQCHAPPSLPVNGRAEDPLKFVKRFIEEMRTAPGGGRVLFVAQSSGRRETLLESFQRHGVQPTVCASWQAFSQGKDAVAIAVAPIDHGLVLDARGDHPALAVVAEPQLFGERARQRRRRRRATRDAESIVRDLSELNIGAPVVHEDHGVGRYLGLQSLELGGVWNEFLCIEYAGGDKLYVPVASLHLVGRYTGGDAEHAPMHKLGTSQWQKAKRRAAMRAHDVAAELLEVQARRAARPGHAFEIDREQLVAFEQGFAFETTGDQQSAIDTVLDDLAKPAPMDRLVCGDVGFGKTEVALRAAFIAVNAGTQVALLVPTTLLAQQHQQTFSDRFADWPIRCEQLSRFRSVAERNTVVRDLAQGKVDIVIGTHQLLSQDVKFKRLGLAIIDEEHRFGVRQKEKFKQLRAETDVLTLTATPIPRTLNMALSGMRDLSLIATPPERRLSIKTFVREWNGGLLREAIQRELRRGGQIFVVHNKVETIDRFARDVQALVPEATLEVAHGQMRERDLERTMLDFYHRRFHVLVCTTIIETGIDIPSANTIIINRADHFGLAQLHQLRGRVGRSHHRAYAYLVVPPRKAMTADAIKRLEAIESLEDLGIGFTLATHDLEIRGAGELLGDEQSGQINEVGFSLYTEMLERAVQALKAGRSPQLDRPLDHGAEIDLHSPALIPQDYLPDVHTRLLIYKRIASAASYEALEDLKAETIDRFGLLPEPTKHLFEVTGLKLKAVPIGVRKADMGPRGGRIVFNEAPNLDPADVVRLIQSQPKRFRLDGPDKLRVTCEAELPAERVRVLSDLFDTLGARDAA